MGVLGRRGLRDREVRVEPDVLDFSHSFASQLEFAKESEMRGFLASFTRSGQSRIGGSTAGTWPPCVADGCLGSDSFYNARFSYPGEGTVAWMGEHNNTLPL